MRPRADWSPEMLSALLNWFLSEIVPPPHAVVAAGHAASCALHQAGNQAGTNERLVLIAPTWRGPLPTMMGGQRAWFAHVRAAIDHWGVGPLLYRVNVSRFVVTRMAREHVYEDPAWLSGDRLDAKLTVSHASGARHAAVRFVSGRPRPRRKPVRLPRASPKRKRADSRYLWGSHAEDREPR